MGDMTPLVDRLEARASTFEEQTRWGNHAFGSASDVALFREAAATIRTLFAAASRPEAPQEGWREVLRMLIAADEEAKPNGVMDCVDNDGCPYQSAYMAGIITHARMLADPHPALSKGEGVTDELKGEG